MTDEAKRIEVNQAIEYLREDACTSCIFDSFLGECTSISDCYARKIADLIESLCAELERVKRERDAAVEDLRGRCFACANARPHEKYPAMNACPHVELALGGYGLIKCEYWQWRGVKEVSDAQKRADS